MKTSTGCFKSSSVQRIVLILQENTAFWFRVVDGAVLERFVELVTDDLSLRKKPPTWIVRDANSKSLCVELVLDTTLDEVDRISVSRMGNRLIDRYRRITTLARLRNDYPHASVYSLPAEYQAQVAAVMHPAHLACWGSWLLALQSSGLVFHQVCTGTELVARWSRRFDSQVFLIMQAGNYQRHLLVNKGATIFLRTIIVTESGEATASNALTSAELGQSMAYLGSVVDLSTQEMTMVGLCGSNGEFACDAQNSPCSHEETTGSESDDRQAVFCGQQDDLVAMVLGNPVSYDYGLWQQGQVHGITRRQSEKILKEKLLSRIISRACQLFRCRNIGFETRCETRAGWPLLLSALRKIDALTPSVQHLKSSRYIVRLLKTTVILVIATVVILLLTVVNGLSSARDLDIKNAQIEELNAAAVQLRLSTSGSSAATLNVADSLFLADHLSSLQPVRPKQILSDVATAVTAVPSINLDNIVWAVVESDEMYETLFYALASVGHRQSLEELSKDTILQLELSGRAAGESLFDRKGQLDNLVAQLRLIPGTFDLRIIESPADAALSSNADAHNLDSFRLSLKNDQY